MIKFFMVVDVESTFLDDCKASGRATHAYRSGSYANRWTYNRGMLIALAQVQVLLDLLHEKRVKSMARNRKDESVHGFVEDGYERAVQGFEIEIRAEVEAKYASQWEHCGFFQRRRLRREMEQEIARLVADRAKSISPTALF